MATKKRTWKIASHGWASDSGVTVDLVEDTDEPNPLRASAPLPVDRAKSMLRYAALYDSPSYDPAMGPEPIPASLWAAYDVAFTAKFRDGVDALIDACHTAGERAADGIAQAQREQASAKREAAGWAAEHAETNGQHYGLKGPNSSAAAKCPRCKTTPTFTESLKA